MSFLNRKLPIDKWLRSEIAPLPSPVVITGACKNSANDVNSSDASPDITPPPAHIRGFLASDITSTPRLMLSLFAAGLSYFPASNSSTSAVSESVSGGISI